MATQDIAAGSTVQGQGPVKIPEGVMKPKDIAHGSKDSTPNVASGKPVGESETKIPEGTMKPTGPRNQTSSADIAAGEPVDVSGNKSAEHHAKIPEGIMKPGSVD